MEKKGAMTVRVGIIIRNEISIRNQFTSIRFKRSLRAKAYPYYSDAEKNNSRKAKKRRARARCNDKERAGIYIPLFICRGAQWGAHKRKKVEKYISRRGGAREPFNAERSTAVFMRALTLQCRCMCVLHVYARFCIIVFAVHLSRALGVLWTAECEVFHPLLYYPLYMCLLFFWNGLCADILCGLKKIIMIYSNW